jgi:D-arabinose 5-phosphate isomerase GutQ
MDALHGSSGALESGHLVIAISKGGESTEINQLLTLAKSRGVKVVALTAKPESSMAAIADTTVVLHTSDKAALRLGPSEPPYGPSDRA